ncbi:MAG: rod shape-determining protein MreC [Oscillospiraceae bacterium]|nr:rod shape-determining protein MreC [Oscillospiraceae bacterium]
MGRRFWTKKVKIILAVAVALAILVTLGAAVSKSVSTGESIITTILTPLRSALAAFDRQAERIYGYLFRYDAAVAENETLRRQLAEAEGDVRDAEVYRRENERLRELLGLASENPDYKFASAYVASWSVSDWEVTITVDKGSADGLAPGMCAVTSSGQVVGLISAVGPNWAKIVTVFDASSEISAAVAATGETGVVLGGHNEAGEMQLQMRYLSTAAAVRNGDEVVTTGSTLYPRGLLLGTVTGARLDETGIDKYAVLDCGFRVDHLEQVFLITEYAED